VATEQHSSTGEALYQDAIGKIEPYGIEHIPDEERHGRPRDQFTVYFAINVALATMTTGFFPFVAGLSMVQGITSIVAGAAVGALVLGVLSTMGSRLGVTQPVLARGPLGRVGQVPLMAYAGVFGAFGWATINLLLGGQALRSVIHSPLWIGMVILAVGQGVVGIYGYNMVHLLNKISTVVIGALFLVITILALQKANFSLAANPHAAAFVGGWGGWITSAGVFLALLIGFSPFSADYSRYLPASTSPIRVAGFTALGNFLAVGWLGCLGFVVASFAGNFAPVQAVRALTGGFAPVALIGIALSTVALNGFNMYGGSMSLLGLGVRVSRPVAVAVITVGTVVVGLVLQNNLYGTFYNFLVLTGYVLAPYCAVTVLDFYLSRHTDEERVALLYAHARPFEWGFVAWLIGIGASVPFWVWIGYTGPIARANPGMGDLTYYVGAAAGSLAYLLLRRLPELSTLLGSKKGMAAASEFAVQTPVPSTPVAVTAVDSDAQDE